MATVAPYLLPDIVVAEEAANLALGERAAGEGIVVPGQQVHTQHLDVSAVEGAARQGAASARCPPRHFPYPPQGDTTGLAEWSPHAHLPSTASTTRGMISNSCRDASIRCRRSGLRTRLIRKIWGGRGEPQQWGMLSWGTHSLPGYCRMGTGARALPWIDAIREMDAARWTGGHERLHWSLTSSKPIFVSGLGRREMCLERCMGGPSTVERGHTLQWSPDSPGWELGLIALSGPGILQDLSTHGHSPMASSVRCTKLARSSSSVWWAFTGTLM